MTMRSVLTIIALTSLPCFNAFGEAGSWVVRGGPTLINNGLLSDNGIANVPRHRIGAAALDMRTDDQLSFSVAYFLSNRISFEYLGARQVERALRFRGVGDLGENMRLPPTLTARYHFRPYAKWRPYIGAGVNWTNTLRQEQLNQQGSLRLRNAMGYALQTGVYHDLTDHWVLNFEARYNDISAELREAGRQIGEAEVDPLVVAVKLGYRF